MKQGGAAGCRLSASNRTIKNLFSSGNDVFFVVLILRMVVLAGLLPRLLFGWLSPLGVVCEGPYPGIRLSFYKARRPNKIRI